VKSNLNLGFKEKFVFAWFVFLLNNQQLRTVCPSACMGIMGQTMESWLRYVVAVVFGYALAVHTWPEPACQHIHAAAAPPLAQGARRDLLDELGLAERPRPLETLNVGHTGAVSRQRGKGDLDFIEIGTSSFETLIEKVSSLTWTQLGGRLTGRLSSLTVSESVTGYDRNDQSVSPQSVRSRSQVSTCTQSVSESGLSGRAVVDSGLESVLS
jgi:hypothetical protein